MLLFSTLPRWLAALGSFGQDSGLPTGQDLVAGVRRGDDSAARALVEALYPTVIRIIRSHLPARTDEEDLAQEVFMKMFAKLDQFRGEQPLSHWVSRITTNTCLDALRRQKVRPEVRFGDLSDAELSFLERCSLEETEELAPDAQAEQAEGSVVVEKLLNSLKPDQQTVVRLLDIEQKSVREICNLTGWSASKVKVTAMRARQKLSEVLARIRPQL
jgi:RNA polymerase sigma factor (sigma-70 family)